MLSIMKNAFEWTLAILMALIIIGGVAFATLVVTEARYLPQETVEYQLSYDKRDDKLVLNEIVKIDWRGSGTEAVLMNIDSKTNNVFHLADRLY